MMAGDEIEIAVDEGIKLWNKISSAENKVLKLLFSKHATLSYMLGLAIVDTLLSLKLARSPFYHIVSGRKSTAKNFSFAFLLTLHLCKKFEEKGERIEKEVILPAVKEFLKRNTKNIPTFRLKVGKFFITSDIIENTLLISKVILNSKDVSFSLDTTEFPEKLMQTEQKQQRKK